MTITVGGGGIDSGVDESPSPDTCCLVRIKRPGPVRLKRESSLMQIRRPGPIVLRVCSGSSELEEV